MSYKYQLALVNNIQESIILTTSMSSLSFKSKFNCNTHVLILLTFCHQHCSFAAFS